MKICVAQTKPIKGDIQQNIVRHLKFIDTAVSQHTDLIIFPELSLTGYEPAFAKTLATNQDDSRLDVFQTISNAHQIAIGVGLPTKDENGRYISTVLLRPHTTRQTYCKKHLHADETPFFVRGQNFPPFQMQDSNIALAICYEISVHEHAQTAVQQGGDVYIASVAKSAAGVAQAHKRLAHIAKQYAMPVLMSNCVGLSEGFVSAGSTAVWDKRGNLLAQLGDTNAGILIFDGNAQEVQIIDFGQQF